MRIPKLLMIRLNKEKEVEYPIAKVISDDFIIVSREELKISKN